MLTGEEPLWLAGVQECEPVHVPSPVHWVMVELEVAPRTPLTLLVIVTVQVSVALPAGYALHWLTEVTGAGEDAPGSCTTAQPVVEQARVRLVVAEVPDEV